MKSAKRKNEADCGQDQWRQEQHPYRAQEPPTIKPIPNIITTMGNFSMPISAYPYLLIAYKNNPPKNRRNPRISEILFQIFFIAFPPHK